MAAEMIDALPDDRDISDLLPDPENLRKHNARNIGMIQEGIHEVGLARSIVVDEDLVVLAGNGVVEAAAAAGIRRVRVIHADGDEIIAVQRSGLSEEQKKRLAIYDNRTSELSQWDAEALRNLMELEPEMTEGLWYDDELARDLARLERSADPFAPNVDPLTSSHKTTEEEVRAARKKLDEAFRGKDDYKPVTCPECGHEFYVNPDDVPPDD
jgi:hypothetical protein